MSTSSRPYLIVTMLSALWCAAIFGAPLLKHAGQKELAAVGYALFSRVCHQNDARSFHLDGEKFGVCIRCTAVYFGFLIGCIIQLVLRSTRSKSARRDAFIVSVAPMILDILLDACGFHESTPISRLITGGLFGAATSWFVLPLLIEACNQIINQVGIHPSPSGVLQYVRKAW